MTFKSAVVAVPELLNAYQSGLQALQRADRGRVNCAKTRHLKGSIDLDSALVKFLPNDPRWDYGIGYYNGRSEQAIWVEVHPARSDHVAGVIRKVEWLKAWLKANAVDLHAMTRAADGYVWLSAGAVSFQHGSQQARQLANAGVSFPRKRLSLQ